MEESLGVCARLPLALKVVGCAVAKMMVEEDGLSRWRDFLGVAMLETPDGQQGVHQVLRSSYEALPDQDYKDAFILIACIWPQSAMALHRWERYVVSFLGAVLEGGHPKARVVLQELGSRSLISLGDLSFGPAPEIAVHDLLVDVAIKISQEGRPPRFQRWDGFDQWAVHQFELGRRTYSTDFSIFKQFPVAFLTCTGLSPL